MSPALTFVFDERLVSSVEGAFLTPSPLVASATGGKTLRQYGRAVWPRARDDALAWRRSGSGLAATRSAGDPDALWWAAVDGPFEMSGGVLDLAYRAHVLAAALDDAPAGSVLAFGVDGDPWITVLAATCRTAGRKLEMRTRARHRSGRGSFGHRRVLALRHAASMVRRGIPRSDVLLVLAHGAMAADDASGAIVDRYSLLFAGMLRSALRVATISLEPPLGAIRDARSVARGEYRPWMAFLDPGEIVGIRRDRAMWMERLRMTNPFALTAAGTALGETLSASAVPLAARGLSLARAYAVAFGRALSRTGARAVVAVEGHSNVGRAIGFAAPGIPLLAPQGGIIAPDGSTNAAYDHRALPAFSGARGCPVPNLSLVWGPYYRQVLLGLGHDPGRVEVSGLPREVGPVARSAQGHVLFAAGANDDVCAFAAGFDEEIATIRALRDCVAADRRIVVRLHPGHDSTRYRSVLPSSVDIVTGRTRTVLADLHGASLVVARSSTVLVEALAAGQRVLIANLGAAPDLTGLSAAGVPYAASEAELGVMVERAMHEAPPENAFASPTGIEAGRRIVDAVARAVR